jgi:hypothetical protein
MEFFWQTVSDFVLCPRVTFSSIFYKRTMPYNKKLTEKVSTVDLKYGLVSSAVSMTTVKFNKAALIYNYIS